MATSTDTTFITIHGSAIRDAEALKIDDRASFRKSMLEKGCKGSLKRVWPVIGDDKGLSKHTCRPHSR